MDLAAMILADPNIAPAFKRAFESPASAPSGGTRASEAPAVCRYCDQPDSSWLPAELQRGRRSKGDGIEYHCYAGYAWD